MAHTLATLDTLTAAYTEARNATVAAYHHYLAAPSTDRKGAWLVAREDESEAFDNLIVESALQGVDPWAYRTAHTPAAEELAELAFMRSVA